MQSDNILEGTFSDRATLNFVTDEDIEREAAAKTAIHKSERERLLGGDEASKILAAANWNKTAQEVADMEKAADKRSLSEILSDNADAKQAEFEDKFLKNRPVIVPLPPPPRHPNSQQFVFTPSTHRWRSLLQPEALDEDEADYLNDLDRIKNGAFKAKRMQEKADVDAFALAKASKTLLPHCAC